MQADKTYKRTDYNEFEINSYSHTINKTTTFARVYTDYEDSDGYYEAFNLIFKTAEKDMKKRIP